MDWRIKFINIRQPMLKLKARSGFHDLEGDRHKLLLPLQILEMTDFG
jgi:hypothetical protein